MLQPFSLPLALGLSLIGSPALAENLVLHNATIYTLSQHTPYASAVCIQSGRISSVGGEIAVLGSSCAKATGARHVDLGGATVIPGLTDSHAHLMMESARRTRADLTSAKSAEEVAQAAKAFAQSHPHLVNASGGWVLGFGWDQTKWPGGAFPTRQVLDALFPDNPAYMEQLSGHAGWANSRALAIAGSDIPAKGDPPGGHIQRDANGQPTGVLSDNAQQLIQKHIPALPDSEAYNALSEVLRDCAANGLTGVHDMDAMPADLEFFQQKHSEGNLSLRVYAMRDGATGSPDMPFIKTDDGLLTVRGVKFFSDGAMGSWSAAMLQPYSDRPNITGTLRYTEEDLLANVSAWVSKGYQVATHAIGDAGNRMVLDVYDKLLQSRKGKDMRWRVEHAQILSSDDLLRFAKLGVIPSMQPSHCAADLPYALQRLGHDRASRSYAWLSLLKTGLSALPFGSDFPTAGTIPPLLGFHAAVTRETTDGVPSGGWFPNERVTAYQALKGYTADAAFASFRENELGAIAPGFYADLTILDRDILTIDAPQILRTSILATIVGGRTVYAKGGPLASHVVLGDAEPAAASSSSTRLRAWWDMYARDMHADHGGDIAPGILV